MSKRRARNYGVNNLIVPREQQQQTVSIRQQAGLYAATAVADAFAI